MPDEDIKLLTAEQVAARLALTKDTVYKLCKAGRIPHYKLEGKRGSIRIDIKDLLMYLKNRRVDN